MQREVVQSNHHILPPLPPPVSIRVRDQTIKAIEGEQRPPTNQPDQQNLSSEEGHVHSYSCHLVKFDFSFIPLPNIVFLNVVQQIYSRRKKKTSSSSRRYIFSQALSGCQYRALSTILFLFCCLLSWLFFCIKFNWFYKGQMFQLLEKLQER